MNGQKSSHEFVIKGYYVCASILLYELNRSLSFIDNEKGSSSNIQKAVRKYLIRIQSHSCLLQAVRLNLLVLAPPQLPPELNPKKQIFH